MSIGRLLEPYEKGWKAWRKIAPFFPSEKFVISEYQFHGYSFVLIANLDLIEKVYLENQELFNIFLHERGGMEELKQCFKTQDGLFQKVLENDLILGVLLGYGKDNAKQFSEKKTFLLKPFTYIHPVFYFFSKVLPPYFACDPHSKETLELKKRYSLERKKILQIKREGSLFLQMLQTLEESCSDQEV